jgi:hypothetical protein
LVLPNLHPVEQLISGSILHTLADAREALLKRSRDQNGLALEALVAMIARSQIVVAQPAKSASRFPAGFGVVDISILDWIAAEGQRVGRGFAKMI